MEFEFSAGGVVINKDKKILIIKTKDLKGNTVYTFPKGNIKKGEEPKISALREVLEETGFECKLIKEIKKHQYFYKRNNKLIKKTVYWFLMEPIKKIKEHDQEVLDVLWVTQEEGKNLLTYKSDIELLSEV